MNLTEYGIAILVIVLFLIGAVSISLRVGRQNEVGRQVERKVQLEDEARLEEREVPAEDDIELGGTGDRPKRLLSRLFGGEITRSM